MFMIRIPTLTIAVFFVVFWPPYISENGGILETWPGGSHIRVFDTCNLAPNGAERI